LIKTPLISSVLYFTLGVLEALFGAPVATGLLFNQVVWVKWEFLL